MYCCTLDHTPGQASIPYLPYTEMKSFDIDMEYDNEKTHKGNFAYIYNADPKKIQPFAKIKSKWLQLISDINFYPYPKSFSLE